MKLKPIQGDVQIDRCEFMLGGSPKDPFVFDNEKWEHPVQVETFSIARTPVTQGEFLNFVEAGGYNQSELWIKEGWIWIQAEDGIRDLVRSRGLGDVYKRQPLNYRPINQDLTLSLIHI